MKPANLCTACGLDFGSLSAFDGHRVGNIAYRWSLDREDGRRCLTKDELLEKNWAADSRGRWRRPGDKDASLRFTQLRSRPKNQKATRTPSRGV